MINHCNKGAILEMMDKTESRWEEQWLSMNMQLQVTASLSVRIDQKCKQIGSNFIKQTNLILVVIRSINSHLSSSNEATFYNNYDRSFYIVFDFKLIRMTQEPQSIRNLHLTTTLNQNQASNNIRYKHAPKQFIRNKTKSHDSFFSCLQSNLSKDLIFDCQPLQEFQQLESKGSDNGYYFADSSQLRILRFCPNQSDQQEQVALFSRLPQSSLREEQYANQIQNESYKERQCAFEEQGLDRHKERFHCGSYSNYSQQNSQQNSSQRQQLHSSGILAKNVTKNIGKLLFKFIWKNRVFLNQTIKPDKQAWQNFMLMIRNCKKQNNVTQKFLLARFHGEGEQFKLLRVVAHSFFRRHCLAAVFKSKIKAKRVHFQRIRKFAQALTNVNAFNQLV